MDMREKALREKFAVMLSLMNERQRRILAAVEARGYGRGGVQAVARASGMSRQTIYRGLEDLEAGAPSERVRATGGGRKRLSAHQPRLTEALEALIEPTVRGDPPPIPAKQNGKRAIKSRDAP